MTRRDISLSVALCVSLALHVMLLAGAAEYYSVDTGRRIWLAAPPRQESPTISAILFARPDEQDPWQRLGDSAGRGSAIAASPGDLPMEAPRGPQDQPFLSRDPEGPGKIGDDPSESIFPPGRASAGSDPAAQAAPPQALPALPPEEGIEGTPVSPLGAGSSVAADFTPPPLPGRAAGSAADPAGGASGSGSPAPAADPAPQADSESDPVSTRGAADFRRGSTDVRVGRKHKLTRPHITVAGLADLLTIGSPTVVLKLAIDETGKVTNAQVFRSSGSNEIDQPCKVEAYNWWFEPAKDRNGKPVKDVMLFTIRFL